MTFTQWKNAVNRKIEALIGVPADDLADCPYWDWFNEGMTPADAAREALIDAGIEPEYVDVLPAGYAGLFGMEYAELEGMYDGADGRYLDGLYTY